MTCIMTINVKKLYYNFQVRELDDNRSTSSIDDLEKTDELIVNIVQQPTNI